MPCVSELIGETWFVANSTNSVSTLSYCMRAMHVTLDFAAMDAAVQAYPASVALQEQYWTQARNKSRATFFRVKKAWEESKGEKDAGN